MIYKTFIEEIIKLYKRRHKCTEKYSTFMDGSLNILPKLIYKVNAVLLRTLRGFQKAFICINWKKEVKLKENKGLLFGV